MGLLHKDKQAGASLRECTWMNLVTSLHLVLQRPESKWHNFSYLCTILVRCRRCLWSRKDTMGFQDILEIHRLFQGHIRDLYVYVRSRKRNGQPTLVAYLLAASLTGLCDSNQFSEVLQELLLGCLVNFETSFGVGWLSSPFRKESFSHIEQCFAVNLPDGQTATRDGSNLNCLLAAKQSEHWPVLRETWKVITCFFHKNVALRV